MLTAVILIVAGTVTMVMIMGNIDSYPMTSMSEYKKLHDGAKL